MIITQPAAGEKGTINWAEPGNNVQGNAQSINWTHNGGLGPPTLQIANGAIDLYDLITSDGKTWLGRV
jgi:hypothetical protein